MTVVNPNFVLKKSIMPDGDSSRNLTSKVIHTNEKSGGG